MQPKKRCVFKMQGFNRSSTISLFIMFHICNYRFTSGAKKELMQGNT